MQAATNNYGSANYCHNCGVQQHSLNPQLDRQTNNQKQFQSQAPDYHRAPNRSMVIAPT